MSDSLGELKGREIRRGRTIWMIGVDISRGMSDREGEGRGWRINP